MTCPLQVNPVAESTFFFFLFRLLLYKVHFFYNDSPRLQTVPVAFGVLGGRGESCLGGQFIRPSLEGV